MIVRYWNEAINVVETRYLDSRFVGRPNVDNLFEQLEYVLKELLESKIVHLSMDGPSVNWNVLDKLDNYLYEKDPFSYSDWKLQSAYLTWCT